MPITLHLDRRAWDDWNRRHIAKHQASPEEVEELVAGNPAVREAYKGRLQLIGPTLAGRMLSVVIGPVPDERGVYYVFSARNASRKERRYYEEAQGGSR